MDMTAERDPLTAQAIGIAIDLHRELGPGLLESTYEECYFYDLVQAGLKVQRQVSVPILYKGLRIEHSHKIDLLIEGRLIIEIKTVDKILPVHEAQLLTYLKLTKIKTGLLINFQVPLLKEGIKRLVL